MIVLRDLKLRRGTKVLFEGASLTFNRGQKIGVTGANGSGKSSLLALLLDEIHQDAGEFEIQPGLVLAHVAQETPATDQAAIEYVLYGDAELRKLEGELLAAERVHDGTRIAELHEDMQRIGAYSARARAAQLMHGLGFAYSEIDRLVAQFSGGWRVRLNLARALMCRSDILLLDEPTNHLDIDAIVWLEQWLSSYPGTLLLISHDRDFLDAVADAICHIEGRRLRLYSGNYSAFETQRAAQLAQQQATYEKQQREIAHLQSFVDRFKAKATKARQAQSRIKALARMEKIAAAHVDTPFEFAFRQPAVQPDPVLTLDGIEAGYGDVTVLREIRLTLRAGTRLGLLGRNGAGKSTMMKLLAGALAPLAGERVEGKGLQIGYFAQHQLDELVPEQSVYQHVRRLMPDAPEAKVRARAGNIGFSGERADTPVENLSGGEKARLLLGLATFAGPHLVILDEPTNHLDIDSRAALVEAINEFPGAAILISHDRYLIEACADRLWLVGDGTVAPYEGDLDDYRRLVLGREARREERDDANKVSRTDQRRAAAEKREELKPLKRRIDAAEKTVARLTADIAAIDRDLADGLFARDPASATTLSKARADAADALAKAEEDWLTASAAYEDAMA